ncbi:MAG: hypothetical protein Q9219_000913 [cf. Caloplaca sp. 3 TL-2023]
MAAKLKDTKGSGIEPLNDGQTFIHHAEAVWHEREPYGSPGFGGLLISSYAALCAAFAALGGMVFGYDQGVVSVVLVMPQFLSRFTRVSETASGAGFWKGLLTAMIELGALIGAINQGWIADKISRKYSIVVAVIVFTVGSILQTASTGYAMLIVGRLVGGVGIGMLSMVAPLYISEISPPEIRGALLVLEEFSIVAGICIAYWITYGTRYMGGEWAWRLPFLLQMVPSTILGLGILFLPFSPRWLASKGRDDQALQSLGQLRQLAGLITPPLVEKSGFGAYTFFAVFCLLSLVWTYLFVPETRGRTLEQMDHVFKDASSEEEEARRHAIEVDLLATHYRPTDQEDKIGIKSGHS